MRLSKIIFRIFLALLLAWFFLFCKQNNQSSGRENHFLNVRDSVGYVGMATCRSCHMHVYETFIHTGMGRSFDYATRQKTAAKFGAHAVVYDTARNFYYFPFFKDTTFYVLEYRLENGDTVHQRLEKISYIVGSGQHTKMVNQILISTMMVGVCEALIYGYRAGLDLETVLKSVGSGAAGSWSLRAAASVHRHTTAWRCRSAVGC